MSDIGSGDDEGISGQSIDEIGIDGGGGGGGGIGGGVGDHDNDDGGLLEYNSDNDGYSAGHGQYLGHAHEHGGGHGGNNGQQQGQQQHQQQQQQMEQELATKMLQIQSKRFYLDVKQNRRGRFIKVAEIGADGRRSQIFLALSTAAEFRDHLSTFSDYYSSLGPPNTDNVPEDGKLKSEMMIKDNRRYYLDLKENTRGRFLRVSQTITRGGPRSQIAIPAQGMIEFRDSLTDLLEEFGTNDGGFKGELPEGRHMKVDSKNFYFDIGQNNRGVYMRISEVKGNFRSSITVPEKCWSRLRDILSEYCDKMKKPQSSSSSEQLAIGLLSSSSSSVVVGGGNGGGGGSGGGGSGGDLPVLQSASSNNNINNNNNQNNIQNNQHQNQPIPQQQQQQQQQQIQNSTNLK